MFDIGSVKLIASRADRLKWALSLVNTIRLGFNEDHANAYALICDEGLALLRSLPDESNDLANEFRQPIESLRRVVKWLRIAGFDVSQRLDFGTGCPSVPDELTKLLSSATSTLTEILARHQKEQEGMREVERADAEGVFDEFVKRSPGVGAVRRAGPMVHEQFDSSSFDEGPLSWTETMVFGYANNRWFILEEDFHREVSICLSRTIREVSEGEAARIVLDSSESLDVATLAWAKAKASPRTEAQPKLKTPDWNAETGELRHKESLVRKVVARAANVRKLLTCFQECNWEARIDSPWSDDESGKETLRETIRSLKEGCKGMTFKSDGAGQGAIWEEVPEIQDNPF